jgi:exonuclease SbcC
MIPQQLRVHNFLCYRTIEEPLDLSGISIACLSGENGAGKSSLLDAITWALWGQARTKSDDDLIHLGETEMEVDLIFGLDTQRYQVIRRRNKSKRSGISELYFHIRDNNTWRSLTAASIRETQEQIIRTLRMSYETFSNSAFLRQGKADEFTRKKPAERKTVLTEILGLSEYEELEARAKERARGFEGQIRGLDGKIELLEREAQQQAIRIQFVAEAEERLETIEQALNSAQLARDQAAEQVQQIEALRPQRQTIADQRDQLNNECATLRQEIARRQQLFERAELLSNRRAEIMAGVATLRQAQASSEHLEALRDQYDNLINQQRHHEQALREAEFELQSQVQRAEQELQSLQQRAERRPSLEAELQQLTSQLEQTATLENDLKRTREQRNQHQEQIREAHRLQLERATSQQRIAASQKALETRREELKRQVKEAGERLKDLGRLQQERDRTLTERHQLERERDELEQFRQTEQEMVGQVAGLNEVCNTISQQGKALGLKIKELDGLSTCPLCQSELGHDGIVHVQDEYDRLQRELREQYQRSSKDAKDLQKQLGKLQEENAARTRRVSALNEVIARSSKLEAELQQLEQQRQRQADTQRDLGSLELQLIQGAFETETRSEISALDAKLKALGDTAALEREQQRLDRQISQLETQISAQSATRANAEATRRAIQQIDDEAPQRQQAKDRQQAAAIALEQRQFGPTERAALTTIAQQISVLGYSPEAYTQARAQVRELAHWNEEEQKLQRADEYVATEQPNQTQAIANLARREADLATTNERIDELDRQLRSLALLISQRDEAERQLKEQKRAFQVATTDLADRQANLRKSEEASAELLECQATRRALVHRKGLFDELAVAFGKKGVQALLIEEAIPEIQSEANRLLAHMTDNQMHVNFETQRATKKGDALETLDIKIADGLGTRDYDAYSGGESFRIDFAIRIALSKLLARRAGARLETLVIDEGFGSQDARGRERLVEAITAAQRDFKQILVVTHIQDLKDMFPTFIEITKTPQGSVWSIG